MNHVPGQIIILNGTPRSGKSSIATVIQESFAGLWMNMGVDHFMPMVPAHYQPGMGLRPGGERPDLEASISQLYQGMYTAIAGHSRLGLNVVVDVGHHDCYSRPMHLLSSCARILHGLPVLFVGVRCPIEHIMQRRRDTGWDTPPIDAPIPRPVLLWQQETHIPGIYDLEVDTSLLSPQECAALIRQHLEHGPAPTACTRLAALAQ